MTVVHTRCSLVDAHIPRVLLALIGQHHSPNAHQPWLMVPEGGHCKYVELIHAHKDQCVHALADVAFHLPTSLARCMYALDDTVYHWLMSLAGNTKYMSNGVSYC